VADASNSEKFSYIHSFPDPFETLSFQLKPLNDCLGSGLIVLDANVLLFPFKTGPHALDEIEKALDRLSAEKRLLVPQHALREYISNRPTKIKEFFDQLNKQRNKDYSIPSVAKLIEKVESFQELLEVEKRLKAEVERYRKTIASAIEEVRKWTTNDPVSKMYQRVLSKDSIVAISDDLASLDKEHKDRNSKAMPPGYKDGGKELNSIGDFIIWKTILKIGEQNHSRDLVFVSGEEKSDWVYRGSSEVLYAREELIEEYRRVSKGGTFHLIDFATLLKYLDASEKVVQEVKYTEASINAVSEGLKAETSDRSQSWNEFCISAEIAVKEWLARGVGEENIERDTDNIGVDYIAFSQPLATEYFVKVKAVRNYKHFKKRILEILRFMKINVGSGPTRSDAEELRGLIVFVCEDKNGAQYIDNAKVDVDMPSWLNIRSGYLENGEFTVI